MGNITRKLFGGETEYENTFAKEVTSSCQRARERESGDESESDRPWKQKRLDCNISTSLIQRVVNSGSISRGKRVVKVDRLTTDIVVVTLEDRFPKTLVLKHEVSFPVHDQHHLSDDVASYFMAALTYTFFLRETRMAQFIKSSTDINATAGNVKDPDEESPTKRKRGSLAEDEIYEIQLKVAIAVTMNYTNGPTKILLQFLLTLLCKYYANGRRLVYIAGTHDSLISVFVYNGKETHECITDVFCLCSSCFHPLLIVDCSSTGEDHQQIQDQLFGQLAFVHGLYGLLVRESTLMLYHVDQMTFAASGWIHVGDQVAVKQLFSMLADIMKVCPNCGS